ncbi:MAG: peptidylprolyl isomerase [Nanobdellota archaeon]
MTKKKNTTHGKHEKNYSTIKKSSGSAKKSTKKKSSTEKSTGKKKTQAHATKPEQSKNSYKGTLILLGVIVGAIILLLVIGNLFKTSPNPPAQTEDGVLVASVNDENIYSDEIEKRLGYYQAQYGPSFTEDMVINQTINEVLLLQEAKKDNIKANQGEIDKAVNDWLSQLREQVSDEQLDALLQKNNLTMEEYVDDLRDSIRRQIIMQKVLNETVISKLDTGTNITNVTEEDARKDYEENPDKYNQVKVSHILICYNGSTQCESNRSKKEAKQLAEEVYNKVLEEPENFAELAKEYSSCPSASKGGELNAFTKESSMAEKFKEAAFNLKVNQFTEPVKTEFGYHIIKLLEKKDSFDELKNNILMQLQFQNQAQEQSQKQMKQQQAVQEYLNKLRDEAEIVYHRKKLTEGIEEKPGIQTFNSKKTDICKEDGKPVIFLFTSTTCPHCSWVSEAFDSVAKKYMENGKIKAYHWHLDSKDNILTDKEESSLPAEHMQVFQEFSSGGVPTFVFGCKYYRVGNAYEGEANGLSKEKQEFEAVIEDLIQ